MLLQMAKGDKNRSPLACTDAFLSIGILSISTYAVGGPIHALTRSEGREQGDHKSDDADLTHSEIVDVVVT